MSEPVNLKKLRVLRGLGLAPAAEAIGVPRSVLYRAEIGEGTPHPKNAVKIAAFYGLEVLDVWPHLLSEAA